MNIEKEIQQIHERNKRVEIDKAWELSWTRKFIVAVLTYAVVVSFFVFANLPDPYVNSIVPALAFIISNLALPVFKKIWLRLKK
jgi:hypothetical protein